MTTGKRLAVGSVGPGNGWIKTLCAQFRRQLEQSLAQQGRACGAYEAALVQSATRWEQACLLAQKQLRLCKPGGPMLYDHSKEVARMTDCRDRVIEKLGLVPSVGASASDLPWLAKRDTPPTGHQ